MNNITVPLLVRLAGKTVNVQANSDWSIYQLKEQLYLHNNIPVEDLKVVFAGSELENSVLLKNCQFTQGTVVHAIVVSSRSSKTPRHVTPTNFIAPTDEGMKTQTRKKRSQFYIFCKSNCCSVRPGKLRVRCKRCKDEAFEISSGPNCWEDVLVNNKIQGVCNMDGCDGNIADFYFKCSAVTDSAEHNNTTALPLPLLRTNINGIPCLICTDIQEILLVFPCQDSHVICLDCFASYCQMKLDHRQFLLINEIGYTLPCPGLGESCSQSFIKDVHHFLISGKPQYERYKNFATEEFVLQNGGLLCPGQGCGNGLIVEEDQRRVVCYRSSGGCGHVFCKECRMPHHDGACEELSSHPGACNNTSDEFSVNRVDALHARWNDELSSCETIGRITKPCPGCKCPTEKSGGCNHMSCARCQYEWCWLCQVQWGRNCEADHWFRAS